MNPTSASHQGPSPVRARSLPRAVTAREAGLDLIRRANRWLIAAAVAATGIFSLLAAHAFHGHTVAGGGASSNSSAASSSGSGSLSGAPSAGGSSLQAPAQAPSPAPSAPSPVVSGGS